MTAIPPFVLSNLSNMSTLYYIGIDPSYTRTGLALCKEREGSLGEVVSTASLSAPVYSTDKYELESTMRGAQQLAISMAKQLRVWSNSYPISCCVIEYPVLATRSGAYLGLIQQALFSYYPWINLNIYGVPSTAIKSISRYESKSQLVDFCRRSFHFSCETIRRGRWCVNHDECSAVVLAYIGSLLRNKQYKKSSKVFHLVK